MTVDLRQLRDDLADALYMAQLRPNPRLNDTPDSALLAEYHAEGETLLRRLVNPPQRVVIRCEAASRELHPERRSVALVAVHDRKLVVETVYRGKKTAGLRRAQSYLFDIAMLRRLGQRMITTFCFACEQQHDLSLRWLQHARDGDISERTRPLADFPEPSPTTALDQYGLAFANWIGAMPLRPDQGQPIIATTYLFAASYYHQFGLDPPHGDHLTHLALRDNPEELMPGADRIARAHPYPELLQTQRRILQRTATGEL